MVSYYRLALDSYEYEEHAVVGPLYLTMVIT